MNSKHTNAANQAERSAILKAAAAIALLLVLAGGFAALMTGARQREDARIGGPFTLVSDKGQTVTEHSFPGKYLLVYFGYTHCPDICPTTLNTMSAALDRLGAKSDRVQPLFITLDPHRDTPGVLHSYVREFSPGLLGLTGSEADLRQLAAAYHVVQEKPDADGQMNHSSVLYLMAPDGRFVAPIEADASEMVMAEVLNRRID